MAKNKKTENKKNFFNTGLNKYISKMSKLSLMLIVFIFVGLWVVAFQLVKNKTDVYLITPAYQHSFYEDDISSSASVIAIRTYDENDEEKLVYRIIINNEGRLVEGKDPKYRITSCRSSAGLVEKINETDVKDMQYFSEQSASTPISHYFTINSTEASHPKYIYERIQYKKGSEDKVFSYKEEIELQPTTNDIEKFDIAYNNVGDATLMNIKENDIKIGSLQLKSLYADDYDRYNCGLRVILNDRNIKFHIDVQSWIINEDGEYLPFIGVYNYNSQSSTLSLNNYYIYPQTKAKYLCAKITYYSDNSENGIVMYYKQDFNKLATTFSTTAESVDGNW